MPYPLSRHLFWPWLKRRILVVEGRENIPPSGPALFVANHVGDHDPLLLGAAIIMASGGRKVHAIAKWRIMRFPLWKKWLGIIPLYRDRQKTFALSKNLLERGEFVLVYPENGVNIQPTIQNVKTGAARFALATDVPVIPVGLKRAAKPPRHSIGFVLEILYAKISIHIGEPLNLSPLRHPSNEPEAVIAATNIIMQKVAGLADKQYIPRTI